MSKIENLNDSKFGALESKKITSMSKIFGGIASGADQNNCTDTYDWTPRELEGGQTVNDTDNQIWTCPQGIDNGGSGIGQTTIGR